MSTDGLPPIHPGDFLAEILEETDLERDDLAHALGIDPAELAAVVAGARPVTAELALLFAKAFGQSPAYWMNLQADFDLKVTAARIGDRLAAVAAVVTG